MWCFIVLDLYGEKLIPITVNEIIVQLIGLLLIATTVASPHFKTRKGMLAAILTANTLSCLMFFFADARTGLFALVVTTVRSVVYWGYSVKDKKAPMAIFIIFMVAQAISTAIGWVNMWSLLTLGLLCNTYGQWQTKEKVLKICLFGSALCIGIYCLQFTGAYIGAINKFLQGGSALVALWNARKRAV